MNNVVVQTAGVAASQNIVVQARSGPAFQANAFFNPGFQTTAHSQMAFQQCAFSHTAFQTDECKNDGRSGYWRLFFTQMQEEALKQYEEKKAEVEKPKEGVEAVRETPKPKKVSKPKPVAPEPEIQPADLPKFRRKPIYEQPSTYEDLANIPFNAILMQESVWSIQTALIINLENERIKRRKQARRRAAAFLLMAA